jgi:anti-sigma-K factor RskA
VTTHEQLVDDLARYALDELTGAERTQMEEHLETCASCRYELQALRGDLGLLGLSSVGPEPPARSKDRLMRAIAAEPRGVSQPSAPQRSWWWALVPAAAALGLLAIAVGLWQTNTGLRDQLAELGNRNQDQNIQLQRLNEQFRLLTSPDAVHVSLNPPKSAKQPLGTAIFNPANRRMMLMASNLPPVSAGKAYELWILPKSGAPIPAGVFKPDEHGNAVVMDRPMPEGVQATAFAITVEKEEGSDKPTSAIILMGGV